MSQETVRLQFTLMVQYEAVIDHYGTNDPARMADIDQSNWDTGMISAEEMIELASRRDGSVKAWVEPVIVIDPTMNAGDA